MALLLVSAADSEQHRAAARAHPLALIVQKDDHLKSLVEKLEEHAMSVFDLAMVKR